MTVPTRPDLPKPVRPPVEVTLFKMAWGLAQLIFFASMAWFAYQLFFGS